MSAVALNPHDTHRCFSRNMVVVKHLLFSAVAYRKIDDMSDLYWQFYYLTTQLLPTLALAVFLPASLLGLFHRGLRRL